MAVPYARERSKKPLNFSLPYVDASRSFEKNPLIEEAYEATMQLEACKKRY